MKKSTFHELLIIVCCYFSDILECSSNPCLNGGICFEGPNSYFCLCSDGFQGDQCENGEYYMYVIAFPVDFFHRARESTEYTVLNTHRCKGKTK